jgi:predicted N-acetyltransferase YhbS
MRLAKTSNLLFSKGTAADLPAINRIVSSAVMSWPMAERVKRLSVPVLCYDATDLTQFDVFVCERLGHPIGVALFDLRHDQDAALLHGLYVLPIIQNQGVGNALMTAVFDAVRQQGIGGAWVRSERVSTQFFAQAQLERVSPRGPDDYPNLFFKAIAQAP